MEIPVIRVGDLLELKKPHPCGKKVFRVLRIGSDIRIVCCQCGRDLTVERVRLEKMIRKITPAKEENHGQVTPTEK